MIHAGPFLRNLPSSHRASRCGCTGDRDTPQPRQCLGWRVRGYACGMDAGSPMQPPPPQNSCQDPQTHVQGAGWWLRHRAPCTVHQPVPCTWPPRAQAAPGTLGTGWGGGQEEEIFLHYPPLLARVNGKAAVGTTAPGLWQRRSTCGMCRVTSKWRRDAASPPLWFLQI